MKTTTSEAPGPAGFGGRAALTLAGTLAVVVTIILSGFYLDAQNNAAHRALLQTQVEKDLRMIRSAMNARLQADLAGAGALADTLAADSIMPVKRLEALADSHIARNHHFSSIGIAPSFALYSVRPAPDLKGDTRALTARLLADLKEAVAKGSGSVPAPAVTRSEGYIAITYPVAVGRERDLRPWGALVFLIDEAKFLEKSGLPVDGADDAGALADLSYLALSLREESSATPTAAVLGPRLSDADKPAIQYLSFPGGAWELLGAPRGGWDMAPENQLSFRIALSAATLALVAAIVVASFLINERNNNIAMLGAREEKLFELSQRFDLAMEASNIGIWEVRQEDQNFFWDKRAAMMHGCVPSDGDRENRLDDWLAAIHPDDLAMARSHFFGQAATDTSGTFSLVYRVPQQDGTVRYLRSAGALTGDGDVEKRLTGIAVDVTADMLMHMTLRNAKETSDIKNAELELALDELSSREHELAELSHKFDLALASYNCGIWEGDMETGEAFWDERMHQLYGLPFSGKPVTPEAWLNCLVPEDREPVLEATNRAIVDGGTLRTVQRINLPEGEIRFIRSVGQYHQGREGQKKLIGIAFDITDDILKTEELKIAKEEADARNIELEIAKNRIEFNALHDPLTSLANRRKFDMELDALTRESRGERQKFSILHLDLDRFKEINDTLGHAAGDAMLVHAAQILMNNVRSDDLVARIGGDEFVVLARGTTSESHLAELSQRVINEMSKPIDFEGFSCRCGVSIGIAQASGTDIDARKVLINADIALYEAKGKGRNCYEFFTQELQANIVNSKRMSDDILAGLERDEFTVWYQPQFDAHSMRLCGVEALVRWQHPDRGLLASNTFLKAAEELNVMARIDQMVLEKALRDKMRLAAHGIRIPKVSVNVSSKRLHDAGLIESLKGLSLVPGEICFELVESIFLDESDDIVSSNIEQIKELGIDVEIDDFGTGHTSIVSLLKLKPKRLKIDRQLVMPILNSPQERALVRSIIDIARSLGVETVAEGVETLSHAELLRDLGCDILQGYAFAKPLPLEDLAGLVRSADWLKAS